MNIVLVTPAPPYSRKGNRITALRWSRQLRQLGHRVSIAQQHQGSCEMLIALHARRSAASILRFAKRKDHGPLIVALTGTDLHRDLKQNTAARHSLELADRLVLLQPHGMKLLRPEERSKTRVIYPSASTPRTPVRPLSGVFEVAVVGHLRDVKDPLRAAMAARRLPADSLIRIVQMGSALNQTWQKRASREAAANPRYQWLGALPHWRAMRRMQRSRLVLITSKIEGCPNAAAEALAAGVPIISSRISGMLGLLADDYPGYFEVGDTAALTRLLSRAETDAAFYHALGRACRQQRKLVKPRRELQSWKQLLTEITGRSKQ